MSRFTVALVAAVLLVSCADSQVDTSQYAVDVDHSGAFDCHDLDQVHVCINHHIADACALADVNRDGVVDDLDAHDISTALHDAGVICAD